MKNKNFCLDCGKEIDYRSKRCRSCSLKGHSPPRTAFKKGYIMSKEIRKKISKKLKGRMPTNVDKFGEESAHWQGGKTKQLDYIMVYSLNHPYCNNKRYVREHRIVMEAYLRKHDSTNPNLVKIDGILYLKPEAIVHHNGTKYPIKSIENKQDNRIENLKVFKNNAEHTKYHKFKRRGKNDGKKAS